MDLVAWMSGSSQIARFRNQDRSTRGFKILLSGSRRGLPERHRTPCSVRLTAEGQIEDLVIQCKLEEKITVL